jgi:uncharacterized protein YjdB
VQLTATALDAAGTVLEDRSFEWTSGIGTVASVSPTGLVTGLVKGQSEIRATTEGVTGSIVITVRVAARRQPAHVSNGNRQCHRLSVGDWLNETDAESRDSRRGSPWPHGLREDSLE